MDRPSLENVKIGDLVFFMDNSWLSKAIRFVETGKPNQIVPSHVAIVESIIDNDLQLLEASFTVRRCMLSDRPKAFVWLAYVHDPKSIDRGLSWVRNKLGEGYDYGAILGIFARSFWRMMGPWWYDHSKKIKNFLDSKTRFFCSELVFCYIKVATGFGPWDSDPSETTPYDIYRSELITIYDKT